ncbi:MAG: carotenoid oxygenase family protein [Elainellaceae cyanobacterium]
MVASPDSSTQTANSTAPDAATPAWFRAIAQPATEFPLTPLSIVSGAVPAGLQGSLYRNGPGRLERGEQAVGHWFDGDGAVLAVHFTNEGATATYRYVRTAAYVVEDALDQFLYGGYGMTSPGALWERWGKPVKNAANTSVLGLPDRLLALWEGGNPHALDLEDLSTIGRDDRHGALHDNLAYSAHPKQDPVTGEIYNFGLTPGLNSTLNLYRSDRTGKILCHATVKLEGTPLIHDFVLAGRYLIFCVPPVQINLLPVGLQLQSFSDAMQWQPQRGTQVIVIDRETLAEVSRSTADAWYQWHFSNGYEDAAGHVVLDVLRYRDFKTNQFLKEIPTGDPHTETKATFWRMRIDPQTGNVLSQDELLDRSCEFAVVKPHQVGQQADVAFLNIHRPGANLQRELFGAIACFSPETQALTVADMGINCYPSEPIYAPDSQEPNQGWVLTVVFDGNSDTSEVWIFDAEGLDRDPVCRLRLPRIIPHSFHGTWVTGATG